MSKLPVPSNVPAARSVALSLPNTWSGDELDIPENIVAITAASYESLRAYAAELEATSLKLTCDILVSISSTMNLKAFALSTTRESSWSVNLVAVVSLPLV